VSVLEALSIQKRHLKVVDKSVIWHTDDATLAVNVLQEEEYNPILYFKPHDDHDHPQLSTDTFMLILQTEFQRKMYSQLCSKILCID